MNIKYYELHYTVIRKRDEKDDVEVDVNNNFNCLFVDIGRVKNPHRDWDGVTLR